MDGIRNLFRKKLEDGDLSPEIISQIESMAATGADASTISALVGVSEEQVNNVLMSGSTSEVMPVEGEEMVETAEVTEEADPLLNLFQQNNSLNNDQAITTLFAQQEPQGIMAAKGGLTNYLKENAPKGEFLAYINSDEATMLKKAGGSGKLVNGIPSFEPGDYYDGGSYSASKDTGSDKEYSYKGPADLGVTTRTVNKITPPPATTRIGGKTYDVTPETKSIRDRAEVKEQIMRTPLSTKVNKKKGLGGYLLDGLLFVASGSSSKLISGAAKGYTYGKNLKNAANFIEKELTKPTKDTKDKTWKDVAKSTITKAAKEKIVKEAKKVGVNVSIKDIDAATEIAKNAWNSDLAESLKNKFTETFKTSPKEKTTDPNELFSDTPKPIFTGGDNDGPAEVIIPMVPEFLEEEVIVEEPETSLFSMSNLNRIRDRQNRRRSFFANRGGLAGLFRVKNQ